MQAVRPVPTPGPAVPTRIPANDTPAVVAGGVARFDKPVSSAVSKSQAFQTLSKTSTLETLRLSL